MISCSDGRKRCVSTLQFSERTCKTTQKAQVWAKGRQDLNISVCCCQNITYYITNAFYNKKRWMRMNEWILMRDIKLKISLFHGKSDLTVIFVISFLLLCDCNTLLGQWFCWRGGCLVFKDTVTCQGDSKQRPEHQSTLTGPWWEQDPLDAAEPLNKPPV